MPLRKELASLKRTPKVVVLGSGGLSIGQAGEFDYSGTQAIKALREEGIDVVVVNPNIATVQTNPEPGCKVYLYPVEASWVERVLVEEKADAIVAGFGGQTALNCLLKLDELGVLKRLNVLSLGTSVDGLRLTEDRELFANKMREIDQPTLPSVAVSSTEEALKAAEKIGYPIIVRAAYALGGLGSGFADDAAQLRALSDNALAMAPQILIEKSLKGWKEIEYEVMRDGQGNTITICNMENIDPLGIHTGDSIVVCPSQTLSDEEYQMLRNAAIRIAGAIGINGECNVQYALDPVSLQYYVIEVNARLSRSSALASKASGYPIAYIAAKIVLGYDLLELKNPVTGITTAFYEPALDYVTVKIPRWDMGKFQGASRKLGSGMKSVGEVMSIGRNLHESLQKAVRMVTERAEGLSARWKKDVPRITAGLEAELREPTDQRLFFLFEALRAGMTIERAAELTRIDRWFLVRMKEIVDCEGRIAAQAVLSTPITKEVWREWKTLGFNDEQIAAISLRTRAHSNAKITQQQIQDESLRLRKLRVAAGVTPVVKKIDTTAAEYPSPSNYLYMSYGGTHSDPLPKDDRMGAVVLGSGAYRVGASVEFDWCAVSCARELRESGWKSVILNCNPETVSTDYNSSDRLYFDELTLERILDIVDYENPRGVVVAMGGQLPNCLSLPLARAGVKLLGHDFHAIDQAEDRHKFSALLDRLGIDQPRWTAATSKTDIDKFVDQVGFPVLVRPSYVLSGSAMNVAFNRESLDRYLSLAEVASSDFPIVLSKFFEGAAEIELDGVAQAGEILESVISEHVEHAGIHSGDATLVVPAHKIDAETLELVRKSGAGIARELKLNGPFNIQFLARPGQVHVIECNARASRSLPFVSKVTGLNLAKLATQVIMGRSPKKIGRRPALPFVGVKAAMFSFGRLAGADPLLGVEMTSTGEVGCIGASFDEALLLALHSSHVLAPRKGALVSAGPEQDKAKFLETIRVLEDMKIKIYATAGTAKYLEEHGHKAISLAWPGEAQDDVIRAIREGWVDFVINVPKNLKLEELQHSADIRKAAVRHGCSLITDMEKVTAFLGALGRHRELVKTNRLLSLPKYVDG